MSENRKIFNKLSKEYEDALKSVNELIEKYKVSTNQLSFTDTNEDYERCIDMIHTLNEEKLQIMRVINHLKRYYDEDYSIKNCV